MKKFLIVAHYSRFLVQFEMNDVKLLQELGYEVHYATNYEQEDMYADAPKKIMDAGVILHQIDFVRSPYKLKKNVHVYQQLKKLMEEIKFDGVHCHTPMGGMLTRIAAKVTKIGPVIYTAHGFHFFKGAPLINWLFYYPVEKFLSRWTDLQITINEEDYQIAKNKMHAKKVVLIPGVGVDTKKFLKSVNNREETRKELGFSQNDLVLISVGEVNENKNHGVVIEAIAKLKNEKIKYIICGQGDLEVERKKRIKELCLANQVKLLGFRSDVKNYLHMSDVFVFPSKREGLAVAPLEAMACGLPLISAEIRGVKDYTIHNKTGYCLQDNTSVEEMAAAIKKMYEDKFYRESCGSHNQEYVKRYDISKVTEIMKKNYLNISKNNNGVAE